MMASTSRREDTTQVSSDVKDGPFVTVRRVGWNVRNESLEDCAVVLLMGPSGAGKSNYIETIASKTRALTGSANITGIAEARIDPGIHHITAYRLDHKYLNIWTRKPLILVDTPGFCHPGLSEMNILSQIKWWMDSNGVKNIDRLLYFDRISDHRVSYKHLKSLIIFKDFCGIDAAHKAAVVTTTWDLMWNTSLTNRASRYYDLLCNDYWKDFLDRGCKMDKFNNTFEAAVRTLQVFGPPTMQIGPEFAFEKAADINDTDAGRQAFQVLTERYQGLVVSLQAAQVEIKQWEALGDEELHHLLHSKLQEIVYNLRGITSDLEGYSPDYGRFCEDVHGRLSGVGMLIPPPWTSNNSNEKSLRAKLRGRFATGKPPKALPPSPTLYLPMEPIQLPSIYEGKRSYGWSRPVTPISRSPSPVASIIPVPVIPPYPYSPSRSPSRYSRTRSMSITTSPSPSPSPARSFISPPVRYGIPHPFPPPMPYPRPYPVPQIPPSPPMRGRSPSIRRRHKRPWSPDSSPRRRHSRRWGSSDSNPSPCPETTIVRQREKGDRRRRYQAMIHVLKPQTLDRGNWDAIFSSRNPVRPINIREVQNHDIVILLLGVAGSGKSSFISAFGPNGTDDAADNPTGDITPPAKTDRVKLFKIEIPNENFGLVLVDTPGFNAGKRSEYATLRTIASGLFGYSAPIFRRSRDKMLFNGVVYFEPMEAMDQRSKKAFLGFALDICGYANYDRVAVRTTAHGDMEVVNNDKTLPTTHKEPKMGGHWTEFLSGSDGKPDMKRLGCFDLDTVSLQETRDLVRDFLWSLVREPDIRISLQLQTELNDRVALKKTLAGKVTRQFDKSRK